MSAEFCLQRLQFSNIKGPVSDGNDISIKAPSGFLTGSCCYCAPILNQTSIFLNFNSILFFLATTIHLTWSKWWVHRDLACGLFARVRSFFNLTGYFHSSLKSRFLFLGIIYGILQVRLAKSQILHLILTHILIILTDWILKCWRIIAVFIKSRFKILLQFRWVTFLHHFLDKSPALDCLYLEQVF